MITPRSLRLHIGFFGRTNVGKSSLINALSGREVAIVSDYAGTTTDPVFSDVDLLNLPVTLVDTAGLDDVSALSAKRVERALNILRRMDVAVIVFDPLKGIGDYEKELAELLKLEGIDFVVAINKSDLFERLDDFKEEISKELGIPKRKIVCVSALKKMGLEKLIDRILRVAPDFDDSQFLDGIVEEGDLIYLNIPIDLGAPKGRLIYPQVQAIRNILDLKATCVVVKERELKWVFDTLGKPKMVITDSHAFTKAAADTPEDVMLTSFSILEARFRTGNLAKLVEGVLEVENLKDGDRVLVAEACTHHPSPDDIGRVKIPRWIRNIAGDIKFDHVMGGTFPSDLSKYKLIIHCGACTLTRRHMMYRIKLAEKAGVKITNYGLVIAYVHGILPRAIEMFPEAMEVWKKYKG